MDVELPDSINETVPPKERLELAKKIEHEYEEASKLLKKKQYKEALKRYKLVFSQEAQPYFHFPSREIARLMKGYPPAVTVIRRWRNDKEKLIMSEKFDLTLIRQWRELNSCVGEEKRTLEVFLKLKERGATEKTLHALLSHVWKSFARSKKYDVLASYMPDLGFRLLVHATEYDGMTLFPRDKGTSTGAKMQRRWEFDYHVDYMLHEGTLSYEIALGLGMKSVANAFAKKILGVETSDRAYAGLIRGAIRARAYDEAATLFGAAKTEFTSRKLRACFKTIRRLPKSYLARLNVKPLR